MCTQSLMVSSARLVLLVGDTRLDRPPSQRTELRSLLAGGRGWKKPLNRVARHIPRNGGADLVVAGLLTRAFFVFSFFVFALPFFAPPLPPTRIKLKRLQFV